jgi:hypothetical protein
MFHNKTMLTHGKCGAGGNCHKYCTFFLRSDENPALCSFCAHHICDHTVIGVQDSEGQTTLIAPAAAPQPTFTAPVTSARERQSTFTRDGVYAPKSTGMPFCFVVFLCLYVHLISYVFIS